MFWLKIRKLNFDHTLALDKPADGNDLTRAFTDCTHEVGTLFTKLGLATLPASFLYNNMHIEL